MSDLRTNSILGAALGAVLGVMAIGVFANGLVHPNYPEKAGYLPEVAAEDTGGGPAAPAGPPDFGRLFADQTQLASMVTHGQQVTAVCGACHDFTAGGPNRTGPNLHDVFGRHSAAHPGFDYSDAMKAHNVTWDYLTLNTFLTSPSTAVAGTRMAFAGIHNDNDRVAAIAYLRSISPNNVPLPAPLPAAAPAAGATTTATTTAAPAAGGAAAPAAHPTH
ncbi:MAG: cytochrome c family protein [Vitreimonas sp.]